MSVLTDIVDVLNMKICEQISFRFDSVSIDGKLYRRVAEKIVSGDLQVVQSDALSNSAAYNRTYNALFVASSFAPNLLIHEMTHAINDLTKVHVSGLDDEAACYIAQTMYMFLASGGQRGAGATATANAHALAAACQRNAPDCSPGTINAAASIAVMLLGQGERDTKMLSLLRSCILRDPTYHASAKAIRKYDGITKKTIPNSYLNKVGGTILT